MVPILAVACAVGAKAMPGAFQRLTVEPVLGCLWAKLLAAVDIAETWVARALIVDHHAIVGAVNRLARGALEALLAAALAITPSAAVLAVMLAAVIASPTNAAGATIDTTHTIAGAIERTLTAVGTSPLPKALAHAAFKITEAAAVGGAVVRAGGSLTARPCPARVALAHAIAALAMARAVERTLRDGAVKTSPARLTATLSIDTACAMQATTSAVVFGTVNSLVIGMALANAI